MHEAQLIRDLAVVMIASGITTLLFRRLKQPVVLGYLLAGLLIGPHTPPSPLIQDQATIATLAELGIIFLMFSLGLEFNLRKLTQVGAPAVVAALAEIVLLFWVGNVIGRAFGWSAMNCIFLGAMLSMSSTTVIIKVLTDSGRMKERFAELIFGILIIEDILGIAMIALLSGIAMTGGLSLGDVGMTLGKLGVFLAVVLVVGLIAVPRLIGYAARFKSDEMLIIAVLGLCFGVSLLALKLGYSVALGAFVIGAVIAEARQIHRVIRLVEPLRDMFSAVFFVAIGMLIDPKMLVEYALPIAVITSAVVVGKVVTCSLGTFAAGVDGRTSLRVGMGLAQIGEFSFIIAALGQTLNVTDKFLYPIAVAVSSVTTLFTPYLMRSSDMFAGLLARSVPAAVPAAMQGYTRWIAEIRQAAPRHPGWRLIRGLVWQISLNVALLVAIFIGAAFAARLLPASGLLPDRLPAGSRPVCWLLALVLCMPLLIASHRKIEALAMMAAEMAVPSLSPRAATIVPVFSRLLHIAGSLALAGLVVMLSTALLPPFTALVLLGVVAGLLAWFFGRSFNAWYSRVKFALVEVWTNPPPPEPATHAAALPPMLDAAGLELFTVAGPPVAGQLIRELNLRARSGVSIVALDRGGRRIVNPGPDEELQAGDKILLLGEPEQIRQARSLLQAAS